MVRAPSDGNGGELRAGATEGHPHADPSDDRVVRDASERAPRSGVGAASASYASLSEMNRRTRVLPLQVGIIIASAENLVMARTPTCRRAASRLREHPVEVRPVASHQELGEAIALAARSFPGLHERTGRGPDYYPSRLAEEADLQVVAVAERRVVGLALGSLSPDRTAAVVGEVAVEAHFRRRGVGRAILAELEVRATARGLRHLVLGADEEVAEFYLACGWATRVQATIWGPDRRAILEGLRAQQLAGYEVEGQQEDGPALRVWVPVEGYDTALAKQLSAIEGCSAFVLFTKTLAGAEMASS